MKGKLIIEKSPSNRSKCKICDRLIEKDTYRVVETYGFGKWSKADKYCAKCGKEHLLFVVTELNGMASHI